MLGRTYDKYRLQQKNLSFLVLKLSEIDPSDCTPFSPSPLGWDMLQLDMFTGTRVRLGWVCLDLLAVDQHCLTQVLGRSCICVSCLTPASLSLRGSSPQALTLSELARFISYQGHADKAQSIFVTTKNVWAMVLYLVLTIERPCTKLLCMWGVWQIPVSSHQHSLYRTWCFSDWLVHSLQKNLHMPLLQILLAQDHILFWIGLLGQPFFFVFTLGINMLALPLEVSPLLQNYLLKQ